MIDQGDIPEDDLANRDFLSACQVSPLFYLYGREDLPYGKL